MSAAAAPPPRLLAPRCLPGFALAAGADPCALCLPASLFALAPSLYSPPAAATCPGRGHRPPPSPSAGPPFPPPADGFGAEGRGAEVPPNSVLEVELTLLGWHKLEKVTGGLLFVFLCVFLSLVFV